MVRALNETGVLDTPYKSAGKQKRMRGAGCMHIVAEPPEKGGVKRLTSYCGKPGSLIIVIRLPGLPFLFSVQIDE